MKKVIGVMLAAMALLLGSALPGHAWRGHGGHHGYGHYGYGYGYGQYGYGHGGYGYRGHSGYRTYGYRYPYRYYSGAAPEVSPQQPTVYVQQQAYWYYGDVPVAVEFGRAQRHQIVPRFILTDQRERLTLKQWPLGGYQHSAPPPQDRS